MRHLLLHPTHRKFIRLLRDRVNAGQPIIITQADKDAFNRVCQGQMTMMERHQRIYRVVLTAVYRPLDEIDKKARVTLIGDRQINIIEKCFSKVERNHLGTTIISGYLIPLLELIINRPQKRRKASSRHNNDE